MNGKNQKEQEKVLKREKTNKNFELDDASKVAQGGVSRYNPHGSNPVMDTMPSMKK